jgi:mono/diheme cytochrome c family protein
MKSVAVILFGLLVAAGASAEINEQRAKFNYQMSCQGCHAPDGNSAGAVPALRGHVGYFLASDAGREYLVRVPGSAVSALGDADLAEVLNWIVLEFGGDSVTAAFQPYTAEEVGGLRQNPLPEVIQYRAHLLADIASAQSGE